MHAWLAHIAYHLTSENMLLTFEFSYFLLNDSCFGHRPDIWHAVQALHGVFLTACTSMRGVCVCVPGLANGDLFSRVMANSPGGILPITPQGQPPVYVSAGVQDNIFPINQGGDSVSAHHPIATARRLSSPAARAGYIVMM